MKRRRPLKVGIHQDIVAAVGIAPVELGLALAKLEPGAARIDLAGQAAGAVTEDEAKQAKEALAQRKAWLAQRREARKRAAAAPPAPPPPTKVRLSLDKLRDAARERARAVA